MLFILSSPHPCRHISYLILSRNMHTILKYTQKKLKNNLRMAWFRLLLLAVWFGQRGGNRTYAVGSHEEISLQVTLFHCMGESLERFSCFIFSITLFPYSTKLNTKQCKWQLLLSWNSHLGGEGKEVPAIWHKLRIEQHYGQWMGLLGHRGISLDCLNRPLLPHGSNVFSLFSWSGLKEVSFW